MDVRMYVKTLQLHSILIAHYYYYYYYHY